MKPLEGLEAVYPGGVGGCGRSGPSTLGVLLAPPSFSLGKVLIFIVLVFICASIEP